MTYITGFHAMEELARSRKHEGLTILVASSGPRIKKILEYAGKAGIKTRSISAAELDKLAPDNRGAAIELPDGITAGTGASVDFDAWIDAGAPDAALVVLLDHIEDPHNYGAILRSADAFGADLVIVPERRAAPQTDVVARASAGALAWVPMATVTNMARTVEKLKKAGFWVYAADMGGTPLPSANLSGRVGLVFGAEGAGVSRLVRELCDGAVSVPMRGHVDSLNVSVAAAICMYEVRRRSGERPELHGSPNQ